MLQIKAILDAVVSALAIALPAVTVKNYQGNIFFDVKKRVARAPAVYVQPSYSYLTRPGDINYGTCHNISTIVIVKNARGEYEARTATGGVYDILSTICSTLQDSDLTLDLQPFRLISGSPTFTSDEYVIHTATFKTIALSVRSVGRLSFDTTNIDFNIINCIESLDKLEDLDQYERALDGTMRSYFTAYKKKFDIKFHGIASTELASLLSAKEAKKQLAFYLNKDEAKTCDVVWTNNYSFSQYRKDLWTGNIILTEI